MVDVLHAVDQVGERGTRDGIDLTEMENRLDLAVVDLSARVIVSDGLQRVGAQVACHHVEAARPVVVHVGRRVVEVTREKALYERLVQKLIRPSTSEVRGCAPS